MGCFPFANSRFQMGVAEMGFAEDFGHGLFLESSGYALWQLTL